LSFPLPRLKPGRRPAPNNLQFRRQAIAYDGAYPVDTRVAGFLDLPPALFVDGKRVASDGDATLPVFDTTTGGIIAQAVDATARDFDHAVRSAKFAYPNGCWRFMRPVDRERILLKFADLVIKRGEVFAG